MTLLIALLALNFVIFLIMIAIIAGAGWVEGKKRPREQGRPDSPA